MVTITKKDIVEKIFKEVVEKNQLDLKQKQVQDIIQELLNQIKDNLAKGNRIEFREFGIFTIHETPERIAQNPATLEKVKVPKRYNVRFKQGRLMKEAMKNEPPKSTNTTEVN